MHTIPKPKFKIGDIVFYYNEQDTCFSAQVLSVTFNPADSTFNYTASNMNETISFSSKPVAGKDLVVYASFDEAENANTDRVLENIMRTIFLAKTLYEETNNAKSLAFKKIDRYSSKPLQYLKTTKGDSLPELIENFIVGKQKSAEDVICELKKIISHS